MILNSKMASHTWRLIWKKMQNGCWPQTIPQSKAKKHSAHTSQDLLSSFDWRPWSCKKNLKEIGRAVFESGKDFNSGRISNQLKIGREFQIRDVKYKTRWFLNRCLQQQLAQLVSDLVVKGILYSSRCNPKSFSLIFFLLPLAFIDQNPEGDDVKHHALLH